MKKKIIIIIGATCRKAEEAPCSLIFACSLSLSLHLLAQPGASRSYNKGQILSMYGCFVLNAIPIIHECILNQIVVNLRDRMSPLLGPH